MTTLLDGSRSGHLPDRQAHSLRQNLSTCSARQISLPRLAGGRKHMQESVAIRSDLRLLFLLLLAPTCHQMHIRELPIGQVSSGRQVCSFVCLLGTLAHIL